MTEFRIKVKDLISRKIELEQVKAIFQALAVQHVDDFRAKKKTGELKVPSLANLNAICRKLRGMDMEEYFFGSTSKNEQMLADLYNPELIEEIKKWCRENHIVTLNDYRTGKRPAKFPRIKATLDNFGESWFYEVLGLKKQGPDFSEAVFDNAFLKEFKKWCVKNRVLSKSDYVRIKPKNYPGLEEVRKLTGYKNYFKDLIRVELMPGAA